MISFVVPAHNEEQLLERTLLAINAAARELGHPHEVIVVDDSSSDRTAAIARVSGATVVSVQFRQIGRTRNAGAQAAHGDLLVFVDADTVVLPAECLFAVATEVEVSVERHRVQFRCKIRSCGLRLSSSFG